MSDRSGVSTDFAALGRLGAHTKWAQCDDRTAATQAARDALEQKFVDQVDPDRKLDPVERAKRAENARAAHYQRVALKAAQTRAANRAKKADVS